MKRITCAFISITLCILSVTAVAAPISFVETETSSGESGGNYYSPTNLGAVDIGVNTIRGRVNSWNDPSDGYLFSLGTGHIISSVRVWTDSGGFGEMTRIALRQDASNYLTGSLIDELFATGSPGLGAGDLAVFTGTPLLASTTYFIGNATLGSSMDTTLFYNYEITVTGVPEPSTLILLTLALLAFGFDRSRQLGHVQSS